jgi:uncharacterized protein YjdB
MSPTELSLHENKTGVLKATVSPANATNKKVTWSTSDASVAVVSPNGTVTGKIEGTATVTATTEDGGYEASCDVTVTKQPTPEEIKEERYQNKYPGKNVIVAPGGGARVEGTPEDDVIVSGTGNDWLEGEEGDDIYTWDRGDGHDVILNSSGENGEHDELHFGAGIVKESLVFARSDDNLIISIPGSDGGSVTVQDWYAEEENALWKIQFDDGTVMTKNDIEEAAEQTDDDDIVAVTGVTLSQASVTLAPGGRVQLGASIAPTNATVKSVRWETSDASVATVSAGGRVTAIAPGSATISVTTQNGGYRAECAVTVEVVHVPVLGITLNPAALQLKEDAQGSVSVLFTPADATNKNVSWTTSDASVATVSNGTVTGKGKGTATVTATTEDGNKTAACVVTVTEKDDGSTPKQEYYENKYPGRNVTIAPAGGSQVYGTAEDDVLVGSDSEDWMEGGEGSDIYVYETGGGHDVISNVSNGENDQDELHFGPGIAIANLSFSRRQNDLFIAILDEYGNETGSVTVEDWYLAEKNKLSKIVFDDGNELTTEEIEELAEEIFVAVTGVALFPSSTELEVGAETQLAATIFPTNATSRDVTWSTSNGAVASVSNGKVTGATAGTATITVTTEDGAYTANCVVTIITPVRVTGIEMEPATLVLKTGGMSVLTVEIAPENATNKKINWSTSDSSVAPVNGTGKVTAVGEGTATITATSADGGYTASCVVTVHKAVIEVTGIQMYPTTLTLQEEENRGLIAQVAPGNATNKNVAWETSDASVATVANGTVTAVSAGTATITATTEEGNYSAACTVTVTEKEPDDGLTPEERHYQKKYPGKNLIFAPDDGTAVNGTSSADVIVGGVGGDFLEGEAGDDIYVYNPGGGDDTISSGGKSDEDEDELHFGPGIWQENLLFSREGNDFVIAILNSEGVETGSVTVADWYADDKNRLTKIVFSNGLELTTAELEFLVENSPAAIWGNYWSETLRTSSREGYTVILYGLGGNDSLYGGFGTDVFVGGAGNDSIYARSNVEGGGKKIFLWKAGDENDSVRYFNSATRSEEETGILRFEGDIGPDNVEVRNSGNNVVFAVTLSEGSGSVTFVDSNTADTSYHLDEIQFSDGTSWKWSEIVGRKVVRGEYYSQTLHASSVAGENVTVYGLGGNDTLYGGNGNDTFVGGTDSDTIYARSNVEGGGNKTFVWNIGDGNDTAHYYNGDYPDGGSGAMRFGPNIAPEDVEARNSGNDVVFALINGSGGVTFVGANTADVRYHLEEVRFSDGTAWKWSEIAGRKVVRGTRWRDMTLSASSIAGENVTVYGLEDADTIYGGNGNDTLVGGPGDDTIYVRSNMEGGGNKTFVWNIGDGNDTVYYYNPARVAGDKLSILKFGAGVNPANVKASNSGSNVIFTISNGSGRVTFVGANTTDPSYQPDEVQFSDGTVLQWTAIPR